MAKDKVGSTEMSRRTLLQGVACAAPVIAATVRADRAWAQSKASQASVAYQDSPKGGQQCDNCMLWQPPNACNSVAGTISAQGWCKIYVKK